MSVDPRYPAVYAERYGEPLRRCVCGHWVSVHDLPERRDGRPRERGRCSACDADGPCQCRRYQAATGGDR